jgi:hypothetical protein
MSAITNGGMPRGKTITDVRATGRGAWSTEATGGHTGGITEKEILWRGRQRPGIDDDVVETAIRRVRASRTLELLHQWRVEDGYDPSRGGRPATIGAEAVIVAFLLLANENSALHIREAAALLQFRISAAMRERLNLPRPTTWLTSLTLASQAWEENIRSTLRRQILDPMDPYPTERYTAKSWERTQEILEAHDSEKAGAKKARLDEFMRRFILMTHGELNRDKRRRSPKMDLSIDQTYIKPPTSTGFSRKHLAEKVVAERRARETGRAFTPAPVDPFGGWHASGGERQDIKPGRGAVDDTSPENPNKGVDLKWGWVVNIAARVDATMPAVERFPKLVAAATLSMPNVGVSEEAVKLMRFALGDDMEAGVVDADKAYFANALPERLHEPTRALGYMPSTDYRVERIGQPRKSVGGVQLIDGGMYCPSTPAHLLSAVGDYRSNKIDRATFDARRDERKLLQVHVKEQPNEKGKFRVSCPARGASPTVTCPIITMSPKATTKRDRPHVKNPPDFLPAICRQHAVTMDVKDNIRDEQAFEYMSPEWESFHEHARQSIESLNAGVKDPALESMETASRRRARGFVAAGFFVTLLLVNYNMRKIAAFEHDERVREAQGAAPHKSKLIRRRDRLFYNPYTGTTPEGLDVPEYIEARRAEAKKRRAKQVAGAIPSKT